MRVKYSSKINKIRTFALGSVFAGLFISYVGVFFRNSPLIMSLFIIVGFVSIIGSTIIYFWIGMLSAKTVQVLCPECNKPTKILGRADACMHCHQPLTLDASWDGKELHEAYNNRNKKG